MTRARRPEDRDATDRLLGALTEDADALEAICEAISAQEADSLEAICADTAEDADALEAICEAISAQEAAALDALLDHAEAAREDHT